MDSTAVTSSTTPFDMNLSFRLGKILGIPVEVNITWIFIFALVTFLFSDYFQEARPSWPQFQHWGVGALTALLFFASVLAHELSHSIVAVRIGIPVHQITLFIFGGVSQLAHEAGRSRTEFMVAVVGPLCSLAICGACAGLWFGLRDSNPGIGSVLLVLAWVNLSLAVFNMLPGFPLDGGRVLRSALWGLTGNYWLATRVAVAGGQLLGVLMVAGGILMAVTSEGFQGIWMAVVGLFLFSAATSSYRQERLRERLKQGTVSEAMSTSWQSLPGETPLGSPMVARGLLNQGQVLGVLLHGRVAGIASKASVDRVSKVRPSGAILADAMMSLESIPRVSPQESLAEVMEAMESRGLGGMVVTDGGEMVGIIVRSDIRRFGSRGR